MLTFFLIFLISLVFLLPGISYTCELPIILYPISVRQNCYFSTKESDFQFASLVQVSLYIVDQVSGVFQGFSVLPVELLDLLFLLFRLVYILLLIVVVKSRDFCGIEVVSLDRVGCYNKALFKSEHLGGACEIFDLLLTFISDSLSLIFI